MAQADLCDPIIIRFGGGARKIVARPFPDTPVGPMLIVHLYFDTRDAMGANAVNTAVETLAPLVADLTGGRTSLRILSNLADHRVGHCPRYDSRGYAGIPWHSRWAGGTFD